MSADTGMPAVPTSAVPAEAVPAEAVPAGAVPAGAVPAQPVGKHRSAEPEPLWTDGTDGNFGAGGTDERIELLNATIHEQQAMINTLVVAAGGRPDPEGGDALDGWKRSMLLNRELQERVQEIGEAEDLLRSVVDSLDSRLVILGRNGVIMGANRNWNRMAREFGWHPDDYGRRGDFFALLARLGPELATPVAVKLQAALGGDAGEESVKGPIRVGQGENFRDEHVIVRLHPVKDHHVARVVVTIIDITEANRNQQLLAQASRLESIGQLAAGIAHEINTPVQYVSDNARFLADSFAELLGVLEGRTEAKDLDLAFLTEEIPSALAQSQEGLSRISQIVRAMKDFAHPGQGKAEAEVNRAVESTTQVCRNEWRYVAELKLELDPAVGLVPCYEGELKQVLLNILVNAAQAIAMDREKSGRTDLGNIVVATSRGPETVRISIADDGPGMNADLQRRIFDPFFTTKPVGMGTGQGLSLAYASIAKHGGTLSVDSRPGAGTTFTIEIPTT